MEEKEIKILYIGDVIGEPGYKFLKDNFELLKEKYKPDFIIANAENITEGQGTLERDAVKLLGLGIDVLTGGNHSLDKIQSHKFFQASENTLRPLNYPRGVYGRGFGIYEIKGTNLSIGVINLIGRVYMKPLECPFRAFDYAYEVIAKKTPLIFVDFHAEATAEKIAFYHYATGKCSAIVGTHTHIQTADERISPEGTAYITDVGMTGAYDSVIGAKKEGSIHKFIYGTPHRNEVAENDLHISGIFCILSENGKAKSIERIFYPPF